MPPDINYTAMRCPDGAHRQTAAVLAALAANDNTYTAPQCVQSYHVARALEAAGRRAA